MVGWLFREEDLSLGFLEWMKLLSATLIVRNRQFSQDFFDALATKIASSFVDPDLSQIKKDLILYNALSYIAFADPQEGQVLQIKGIDYTIEKIALTSGWVSSTYYAYGLKAVTDKTAQSFLIFQGTTTPADHGFLAGVMADTRPVGSVGTQLYARGQDTIQHWINDEYQRTQKRVMCTGQSLGGAMALHTYIHQPNAVDYFIVNPPALTNREKRIYKKTSPRQADENTSVMTVASHANDPVLSLGSLYLPKGTKIYRHGKKNENKLIAHAKAPDCSKDAAELFCVDHNNSKQARSYSWKIIKAFLFIATLILHVIALPIRLAIQVTRVIISSLHHKPPPDNLKSNYIALDISLEPEIAPTNKTKPMMQFQEKTALTNESQPSGESASLRFFEKVDESQQQEDKQILLRTMQFGLMLHNSRPDAKFNDIMRYC